VDIQVDSHRRPDGSREPRRIQLDGREVGVAEILDEWPGAGHHYFKVRGEDANLYILRFDARRSAWALILFSSREGEGAG
jgi:hypothetical protein